MYPTPTRARVQPMIATPQAAPEIPLPPEPQSIEQTGLTIGFLTDLALKTLYLRGQMTMAEIASSLGLPMANITDRILEFLKGERLVHVRGGPGLSPPGDQDVVIRRGSQDAQGGPPPREHAGHAPGPLPPAVDAERLRFDHRWLVSKRPIVKTGGELTLETRDLIYDETAKCCEAPFQMKATGGVFLVDDFGRQRVSPKELLNRWIVPLEKRVDYLTLHTGKKIEKIGRASCRERV